MVLCPWTSEMLESQAPPLSMKSKFKKALWILEFCSTYNMCFTSLPFCRALAGISVGGVSCSTHSLGFKVIKWILGKFHGMYSGFHKDIVHLHAINGVVAIWGSRMLYKNPSVLMCWLNSAVGGGTGPLLDGCRILSHGGVGGVCWLTSMTVHNQEGRDMKGSGYRDTGRGVCVCHNVDTEIKWDWWPISNPVVPVNRVNCLLLWMQLWQSPAKDPIGSIR